MKRNSWISDIAVWRPPLAWRAALGRTLDLIYPPQPLDAPGRARPQSHGLSAEAWSKVRFIADPLCDGCGQPVLLIMGS